MPAAVPERFRAFVVERRDDDVVRSVRDLTPDDLPPGDVTIRVTHSSVNYKDGLATLPHGKVARISPLVPGIDLAGEIVEGRVPAGDGLDRDLGPGDRVLVHGYALGSAHHGGYAQLARVPADWVVPLPPSLTPRDAMAIGTAGYTAALSLQRLEHNGLRPGDGPVLVTGASGGVGAMAVSILAGQGYEVVASTGSPDAADWLRDLGASEVVDRAETGGAPDAPAPKPLERQRWAGAVDCVGGTTLAWTLATLRIGAAVAASGNIAGMALSTSVAPFILRGVSLLGVDSANTPIGLRRQLWQRLADDWRPAGLEAMTSEVGHDELPATLDAILAGRTRGRVVVRLPD